MKSRWLHAAWPDWDCVPATVSAFGQPTVLSGFWVTKSGTFGDDGLIDESLGHFDAADWQRQIGQ